MTVQARPADDRYHAAKALFDADAAGLAEPLLRELIAAAPDHARAHHLLGVIAYGAGQNAEAAELIAQAVRLEPAEGDYYSDLGLVLQRMGQAEAAVSGFRAAIRLKPDSAAAYNNLGAALRDQERYIEALKCFSKALTLHQGYVEAYNNLGCVLRDLGKPALALDPLETAVRLRPQSPEIHNSLGNVLRDLGRTEEAVERYQEAVRLNPEYLQAHNNLGSAYCELDRLAEAMASYLVALVLDPHSAEVHNNIGVLLHRMGLPDLAAASYREAIRLDPETVDAPTNLAMALLMQGDYPEGWRLHEGRWRSRHLRRGERRFEPPMWKGGPSPRRLLVHAEQGFGDTLQFCRYLPLFEPGVRLLVEVQPPLVDLIRQMPRVDEVFARGEPPPEFDAHCPMMSLPLAFGTTLDDLPGQTPYLTADPVKAEAWTRRLATASGLKVGLVWAGGARPNQPELEPVNRRRSVSLAALAPLAETWGVSFVSLQKGPPAIEALSPPRGMTLFDFSEDLSDFTDTAALIETLDLVISVDTAVAHLAGAMGKPVWLLNRYDTCWRWMLERNDSRWYPTLRLFRQPEPGDWETPIRAVRSCLVDWVASAARC